MMALPVEPLQNQDECDPGRNDVLVVSDLDVLRLISDPVRIQLLELMRNAPRTVKELSAELNVPPTRLYYHMNLLEEHGLIKVASTRLVSGIVEKRYVVTAARLSVDRSLLSPGDEGATGLETHLAFVLDEAKAEILKSARAGLVDPSHEEFEDGGLVLGRIWLRLTREQAAELDRRLGEIYDEYKRSPADPEDPNLISYEFLVGLYPTTTHHTETESSEVDEQD
jgi:DNA-binding transcriptional ArsR family regulator